MGVGAPRGDKPRLVPDEPARPFSVNRCLNKSESAPASLTRNCSTLKTVSKVLICCLIAAAAVAAAVARPAGCCVSAESLPWCCRLTSVLWRLCWPAKPRLYLQPASLLTDRYDLIRAHFTHRGVKKKKIKETAKADWKSRCCAIQERVKLSAVFHFHLEPC